MGAMPAVFSLIEDPRGCRVPSIQLEIREIRVPVRMIRRSASRTSHPRSSRTMGPAVVKTPSFGDSMPDTRDPQSVIQAAEQAAVSGDYAAAERLLCEAADLQETSLGPLHPELANTLNNLGVVYEVTEKPELAERCFRRASEIATAVLPADHPFVATSRQNLEDFLATRAKAALPLVPLTGPAPAPAPAPVQLRPPLQLRPAPAPPPPAASDPGSVHRNAAGGCSPKGSSGEACDPRDNFCGRRQTEASHDRDRCASRRRAARHVGRNRAVVPRERWNSTVSGDSTRRAGRKPGASRRAKTDRAGARSRTSRRCGKRGQAHGARAWQNRPAASSRAKPSAPKGAPVVASGQLCRNLVTAGNWRCDAARQSRRERTAPLLYAREVSDGHHRPASLVSRRSPGASRSLSRSRPTPGAATAPTAATRCGFWRVASGAQDTRRRSASRRTLHRSVREAATFPARSIEAWPAAFPRLIRFANRR